MPTTSESRPWQERLWAPASWWVVFAFFAVSVLVAVGFYLGWAAGWVALGLSIVLGLALLLPYGRFLVRADDAGLTAGTARIDWAWVAAAQPLDAAQTRDRLGPGADPRAFLATRPYVREAVEVTLNDPADPHPYWLVSTRDPENLAAHIGRHLPSTVLPAADRSAADDSAADPATESGPQR